MLLLYNGNSTLFLYHSHARTRTHTKELCGHFTGKVEETETGKTKIGVTVYMNNKTRLLG